MPGINLSSLRLISFKVALYSRYHSRGDSHKPNPPFINLRMSVRHELPSCSMRYSVTTWGYPVGIRA